MNNQGIEFNEMKSQQKPTPQKAERCKKKKPWPPPLPHLFFLLCPIHHCLFASLSLINKNIHLLNYILFLLDSSPNAFHLALVNLLSGCCCCCSIPSSIISPPLHPLFLSILYLLSKRRDTQNNRKTNREERKEERRAPTPWAVELLPGIPSGFDEIHTEK